MEKTRETEVWKDQRGLEMPEGEKPKECQNEPVRNMVARGWPTGKPSWGFEPTEWEMAQADQLWRRMQDAVKTSWPESTRKRFVSMQIKDLQQDINQLTRSRMTKTQESTMKVYTIVCSKMQEGAAEEAREKKTPEGDQATAAEEKKVKIKMTPTQRRRRRRKKLKEKMQRGTVEDITA